MKFCLCTNRVQQYLFPMNETSTLPNPTSSRPGYAGWVRGAKSQVWIGSKERLEQEPPGVLISPLGVYIPVLCTIETVSEKTESTISTLKM